MKDAIIVKGVVTGVMITFKCPLEWVEERPGVSVRVPGGG